MLNNRDFNSSKHSTMLEEAREELSRLEHSSRSSNSKVSLEEECRMLEALHLLQYNLRSNSSKVNQEGEYNLLEDLHLLQMGRLLELLLLREIHPQL